MDSQQSAQRWGVTGLCAQHGRSGMYPELESDELRRAKGDPGEVGDAKLLAAPLLGIFASSSPPSDLFLRTLDLAQVLADCGATVIGPFQSPLERAFLEVSMLAGGRVVLAPAGGARPLNLPRAFRVALENGQLAFLGSSSSNSRRASERSAEVRNRRILALCKAVLVVSGGTSSRAFRAARAAVAAGLPLLCHEHPRERDLTLLGAQAFPRSAESLLQMLLLGTLDGCNTSPAATGHQADAEPILQLSSLEPQPF